MADARMAFGIGAERIGEEDLLLGQLDRVRDSPADCFAIHIHLSKLRAANRQQQFIDIASRSLDDFISGHDVLSFTLYNRDIVLLCRNVPIDDLDPVIEKVRALFSEDPLTEGAIGSFEDRFTTWHDLAQVEDFRRFLSQVKELAETAEIDKEKDKKEAKGREREADLGTPLAPGNLAAINQTLKSTQIADLIRNQTVYRVVPGERGEIVFREYFIAMAELKNRVAPNVNLFGSPWLFQYLTETLDKRMLAVMSRRDLANVPEPISLNLNISTVTSREFQQFHENIGGHASNCIVELQVIDIFADMHAYYYVRDLLQERGYKVLVDGLSPLAINFFDPSLLQSDYLKISWGPELVGNEKDDKIAEIRNIVHHAGKDVVILSRVDSQDAVKWGASLGITRFQGYFIDKLVAAMRAQIAKK